MVVPTVAVDWFTGYRLGSQLDPQAYGNALILSLNHHIVPMASHGCQVVHRDLKSLNLLLAAPLRGPEDLPNVKVRARRAGPGPRTPIGWVG